MRSMLSNRLNQMNTNNTQKPKKCGDELGKFQRCLHFEKGDLHEITGSIYLDYSWRPHSSKSNVCVYLID